MRQAFDDRALPLIDRAARIHNLRADVANYPDLVHLYFVLCVHAEIDDVSEVTRVRKLKRDSHAAARREFRPVSPTRAVAHGLENALHPIGIKPDAGSSSARGRGTNHARHVEDVQTELERILPRRMRQLIRERLEHK